MKLTPEQILENVKARLETYMVGAGVERLDDMKCDAAVGAGMGTKLTATLLLLEIREWELQDR